MEPMPELPTCTKFKVEVEIEVQPYEHELNNEAMIRSL